MKKNEDLIQIYLIRHGEAEKSWDEDSDPGLSDLGKQQSKEIIEIMIEKLIKIYGLTIQKEMKYHRLDLLQKKMKLDGLLKRLKT